jgi:transglutaminase superfamily protein
MELTPFAVQAGRACPTHADLAVALAAEFRRPASGCEDAFDDLAAGLLAVRHDTPGEQLAGCAESVAARLEVRDLQWAGIDDLLVDRVVRDGAGHPLALAVVCVEAARRAGIPLGVVAGGTGCFVAHTMLAEPLLVDVARGGRLVEAGGRVDEIGWQCSHQVAARILNRIGERSERTGNVAWALRAAELRLALPFARPVLDDLRHALAHLRARMN